MHPASNTVFGEILACLGQLRPFQGGCDHCRGVEGNDEGDADSVVTNFAYQLPKIFAVRPTADSADGKSAPLCTSAASR